MQFTKIITNNKGSILGKIKYATMSDNSHTERSGGSSSTPGTYYHRTSPRSRPSSRDNKDEQQPAGSTSSSRRDQSAAIAEYRERATRSVRTSLRESARSQTHHSREASSSSSSTTQSRHGHSSHAREPRPSRRRHPGPSVDDDDDDSSMARLVADVLKGLSVDDSSSGAVQDAIPAYADHESFFPHPKVTFLVDRPRNVKCAICTETPLGLSACAKKAGDEATMILPCGHSGCAGCLTAWLDAHPTCPFCRVQLVRECGHAAEPVVLARDTIHAIPATTAAGGTVAGQCRSCRPRGVWRDARPRLRELVEALRRARLDAARAEEGARAAAGWDSGAAAAAGDAYVAAVRRVAEAKEAFERFDRDMRMQSALASAW